MEQLAKVDIRITGKIKVIHTEKQSGWIQLLDDETQEFYFIAKQLQNVTFENIKEGDIVSFFVNKGSSEQGNLMFANCIILEDRSSSLTSISHQTRISHQLESKPSKNYRYYGIVSKIFSDTKNGFITPNDDVDCDIFFMARQVQNNGCANLRVGDIVSFSINVTEGGKFANKIIFLFHGIIHRIFPEKKTGWITSDLSLNKNIFFKAEDVKNNQFDLLKECHEVSFRIIKKNNLFFANEILLVKSDNLIINEIHKENKIDVPNDDSLCSLTKIDNCYGFKTNLIEYINSLVLTNNTNEFEDSVFLILRLIGINALYQYDKKNQAGKADGFFIIANLAVMYDCTLRSSFQEHKKDQIENYVNKMEGSQLSFDLRLSEGKSRQKNLKIDGKSKQVWIITKNSSREITDYGNIKVKEVSVHNLVLLLKFKLGSDTIEEYDLANRLSTIENIELTN